MRFVFAIAVAAVFGVSNAQSCQSLCNDLTDCREDPHAHGSYCKTWQTPEVCFGLYWADEAQSEMCFQPNASGACPETNPVRCPVPSDRCQAVCDNTPSCMSDPHAHGSYCRTWQTEPTCFGLYYTDASRTATCFEPVDGESCPAEFPVGCHEVADVTTTAGPVTTTVAPVTTTAGPATTTTTVRATTPPLAAAPRSAAPVSTTLPPTTRPATTARPTTTTSPATTTPAVAAPTGVYRGSAMRDMIRMTVSFTARTVTVTMAAFGSEFVASDVPYTMGGERVVLTENASMTAFLAAMPMRVTVDQIVINYVAFGDEVHGSFGAINIVGRK